NWIKRKRFLYRKNLVIYLFPCIDAPAMIHSQLCKMKKIHLIRLMIWTGCPISLSSKVARRQLGHIYLLVMIDSFIGSRKRNARENRSKVISQEHLNGH